MKPEAIVARTDWNQEMSYYQSKEMKKENKELENVVQKVQECLIKEKETKKWG